MLFVHFVSFSHALVSTNVSNPHSIALGGYYATNNQNVYAANNPASFNNFDQQTFGFSYQNRFLVKELSIISARYSAPLQSLNIGGSYVFTGFSLYNEMIVGFHVAKPLSKALALGVQVDYFSVLLSPDEGRVGAFLPQIGMLVKAFSAMNIGVVATNFTFSRLPVTTSFNEIPSVLIIGADYIVDANLLVMAQIAKSLKNDAVISFGMQYQVIPELQFCTGIKIHDYAEPTFGLGLNINALRFDLGFQYHALLGVTISSGVQYVFAK